MQGHGTRAVHDIRPVVLAGGAGARLWPLSTSRRPKQFHALVGPRSLFQETVARLAGWQPAPPVVVCGEAHLGLVEEQLGQMKARASAVILEPVARNTAPAVALAALHAAEDGGDPLLLVMPADHHIADPHGMRAAVEAAAPAAEAGRLVTFGVSPTRAEPGYGYIRGGEAILDGAFAVDAFVEKPDRDGARRMLESGGHLWNSGIFLFRAGAILAEYERHCPEILAACRWALAASVRQGGSVSIDAVAFASCPSISIDHAVMEKTAVAAVVRLDAGWSDVGSWPAVREMGVPDEAGNVLHGDVVALDSAANLVHARGRSVALIGVSDLVVIETADAVLVAHRDRAQEVRRLAGLMDARRPDPTASDSD